MSSLLNFTDNSFLFDLYLESGYIKKSLEVYKKLTSKQKSVFYSKIIKRLPDEDNQKESISLFSNLDKDFYKYLTSKSNISTFMESIENTTSNGNNLVYIWKLNNEKVNHVTDDGKSILVSIIKGCNSYKKLILLREFIYSNDFKIDFHIKTSQNKSVVDLYNEMNSISREGQFIKNLYNLTFDMRIFPEIFSDYSQFTTGEYSINYNNQDYSQGGIHQLDSLYERMLKSKDVLHKDVEFNIYRVNLKLLEGFICNEYNPNESVLEGYDKIFNEIHKLVIDEYIDKELIKNLI